MMKKKVNIVLILAVLSIWGAAGYRYISNYFREKDVLSYHEKDFITTQQIKIIRDTFELRPLPRDPFLNNIIIERQVPKRISKAVMKPVAAQKAKEPLIWPDIQYLGFIESKDQKNKELILVKVNGGLFRMHKGELNSDVLIKNIYKDSIKVLYKKEERIFKRNRRI